MHDLLSIDLSKVMMDRLGSPFHLPTVLMDRLSTFINGSQTNYFLEQ